MASFMLRRRRKGGVDSEFEKLNMAQEDTMPNEETSFYEDSPVSDDQASWDEYNEHIQHDGLVSSDEYNEHVSEELEDDAKRHNRLKKMLLQPVAATMIGIVAIFASFGVDPLGLDFLVNDITGVGFPSLPNPNPDWEGDYAWSRMDQYMGPELYLRYSVETEDGYEYGYLVKGGAWEELDSETPLTEGPDDGSLKYDSNSNTLYLNNFKGSLIEANEMGNAFTIHVTGENYVDFIEIWGAGHSGSVTFTGNGVLNIGRLVDIIDGPMQYEGGLLLMGEWGITGEYGSACLMVDRGVTLDIYGSPAVLIKETAIKDAIYYLTPIELTGGAIYSESSREEADIPDEPDYNEPVCYYVTIADEENNPVEHVVFAP